MLDLTKFFNMIFAIKEKVAQAKKSKEKIIAVFGWTGSGKSTSINILMGSNLIFNTKGQLVVETGHKVYAEIGHSDHSQTLNPELIKNAKGGYAFFDTAGVMDQREPGKETESSVAACSLPILLQDSAVHAVVFVISKNFLDREGKSSFAELFNSLGNFIDFKHELVERKVFIAMTKTVDLSAIAAIEQQLSLISDNLKGNFQQVINQIYNTSENEIREKLKIRKTTLHLEHIIDERARFGNVYMFHGVKHDAEQFLNKITGCNLVYADKEPNDENIDTFALTNRAAYIRYKNRLYYVNQFENICSKIDIGQEALATFDKAFMLMSPEHHSLRSLSEKQLSTIYKLTGHSHLNEVMQPLPTSAFKIAEPVIVESEFSRLRARVDVIVVDPKLPESQEITQFKQTLHDIIQGYNLLFSTAIHLPDLDNLQGKHLQRAILNLIAYYAQHDVLDYPDCLKTLINCLSQFPQLVTSNFSETKTLNHFLEQSLAHLNSMLNLELPQITQNNDDQIKHIRDGLDRIKTINQERKNEILKVLDNTEEGASHLYWQQLLYSCIKVNQDGKDKFQVDSKRDDDFKEIINALISFKGDDSDDAMVAMISFTLLAIQKQYKDQLQDPITFSHFPLAQNLPLIRQALQQIINLEQNVDLIHQDPQGHFFEQIKKSVLAFKKELLAFAKTSDDILKKLIDDYYHCAESIKKHQENYITAYQNQFANGINLMAGPVPYVSTFNGKNISATLHVAGGGTLNPFLNGHIDKHLLAAEALGLSQFSLGQHTIQDGVASLVTEGKDFNSVMSAIDTNELNKVAGCLPGKHLFDRSDAQWERKVTIKIFNQDAYGTRVYKTYENFQTKSSFYKRWNDRSVKHDGSTPLGPGNLLVNFGAYNVERSDPYWSEAHTNSDGDAWYTSGPNHNYAAQTAHLHQKIRNAMSDYIDIQLSRDSARAPNWSYSDRAVSLSDLDSEITFTNPPVVTHASIQINNWFTTHRTNIANNFRDHQAHPGLPVSAQEELNQRKRFFLNLDIQHALIKLFAKLIGKNPQDNFFSTFITAVTIKNEVAAITMLNITDPSPALTTTVSSNNRKTAQDIVALDSNFKTRYLHPLTLLIRLENILTLHAAWRALKFIIPPLKISDPHQDTNEVIFLRNIPAEAKQLQIRHRDLSSPTQQACLVIALRNHMRFLNELILHDVKINSIAGILQMCGSVDRISITDNPLQPSAFSDLAKFIARNPKAKSISISADPLGAPIILNDDIALNLLAALYLNRNLFSIEMNNIVFESPIIAKVINHVASSKTIILNSPALTQDEYFVAIDRHLSDYLKLHLHPIGELETINDLFYNGDPKSKPLRDRISTYKNPVVATNHPTFDSNQDRSDIPQTKSSDTSSTSSTSKVHSYKYKSTNIPFSRPAARFLVDYRSNAQQGWNCFDVAVGITRENLMTYALAQAENTIFRELLAPEIRHAAAIAVAMMNDPSYSQNHPGHSYGLPEAMRNRELQDLVNNAQQARENPTFLEAFRACCDAIGRREGDRLSLSELLDFFKNEENLNKYQEDYNKFICVYNQVILPPEQAFDAYSSNINTYRQYLRTYYQNHGWIAFQADKSGSIVEIAARMLNATIIIHQPTEDNVRIWREIYRTTNVNPNREINIQLVNLSHFTALQPNPNYRDTLNANNVTRQFN